MGPTVGTAALMPGASLCSVSAFLPLTVPAAEMISMPWGQ
jgi:hypothetical protein